MNAARSLSIKITMSVIDRSTDNIKLLSINSIPLTFDIQEQSVIKFIFT